MGSCIRIVEGIFYNGSTKNGKLREYRTFFFTVVVVVDKIGIPFLLIR